MSLRAGDLLPCPFCGSAPTVDAYDRGIAIICSPCGYRRPFPGLIQPVKNDKPILAYRNSEGEVVKHAPEDATEFYHCDADKFAADEWNKRELRALKESA